jgi:hypothetical protein
MMHTANKVLRPAGETHQGKGVGTFRLPGQLHGAEGLGKALLLRRQRADGIRKLLRNEDNGPSVRAHGTQHTGS